jgi:hypothetical protein
MPLPDFKDHLRRQLAFLARSCAAFDAGFHDEAIRIATIIRVLVHHTSNSTSLLKHLNATTINLLSTSPPTSPSTIMSMGMGTVRVSSDGTYAYFPSLGNGPNKVFIPVSKWWDQEVMVQVPIRLTRRHIVRAAADQDGGTHVDAQLSAEYKALTEAGFAGSVVHIGASGRTEKALEGSHFVCLRQMGYELLHSPELLGRAAG